MSARHLRALSPTSSSTSVFMFRFCLVLCLSLFVFCLFQSFVVVVVVVVVVTFLLYLFHSDFVLSWVISFFLSVTCPANSQSFNVLIILQLLYI